MIRLPYFLSNQHSSGNDFHNERTRPSSVVAKQKEGVAIGLMPLRWRGFHRENNACPIA